MFRVRPFASPLTKFVSTSPPKVYVKSRLLKRQDLAVRSVPSRQFLSDSSRILDNVDEFTERKQKEVNSKNRSQWSPPKEKNEEHDDWVGVLSRSDEDWGSELEEDQASSGEDTNSKESTRNDGYSYYKASSISVLTEDEKEQVLPLIPVIDQARFYWPVETPVKLAWIGVALCGCFLFSSSNLWIAGLFLISPLLVPWILAGLRNWELQSQGAGIVGIWHCQVLNVDLLENSNTSSTESDAPRRLIRFLVGDPWKGGVRVELVVPPTEGEKPPTIGELCDLLVLSDQEDFSSFKVVREAFFPKTRLWLAEYPFINRDSFYRTVRAIQKQQNEILMDQDNW